MTGAEPSGWQSMRWRPLLVAGLLLLAGCPGDVPTAGTDTGPGSGDLTPTDTPQTATAATASPTSSGTATASSREHQVGESFVVGTGSTRLRYQITDVERTDRIGGEFGIAADEQFVVVSVTVTNAGDNVTRLTSEVFTLATSGEQLREPDGQAMNVAENALVFRDLAPGATVSGVVIFDTASESGLRLRVAPVNGTAPSHSVALD